jgi:hypothetical protein
MTNDHIPENARAWLPVFPTAEIEMDITDTLREIEIMKREMIAFENLAQCGGPESRRYGFIADARRNGIAKREEFVAKLQNILVERKQT